MQAVILAAGQSSRFFPYSVMSHKSMIFMMGKPLLQYTIEGLKKRNITEIIIVEDHRKNVSRIFGSGEKLGVEIQYVVQPEPLGMGDALLRAEEKLKDKFLLLNAAHVDAEELVRKITVNSDEKAVLLAQKRENTWGNGVLLVENGYAISLIEKPKKGEEPSNLCVIGIYLFTKEFINILKNTKKSHYQLEEALDAFCKTEKVRVIEYFGETVSLKYPWDLIKIKNYLLQKIESYRGKNIRIAESAEIIGNVYIGDNTIIREGARIKGVCYIGKNVHVGTNAILRDGVILEDNVVIGGHMEVKNSFIMKNSTTHSGYIGDSVIGESTKIAAQFCTANVRLDRGKINSIVKNVKVPTGFASLGGFIGDNTQIGIHVSTMPGIIIGNNVIIGPSTTVLKNIESNKKYYTKFQEVITKNNE